MAPAITSLTPNTGSTSGGTTITATGTNLDQTAYVLFGYVYASFAVVSPTQLTIDAPPDLYNVSTVTVRPRDAAGTFGSGVTYTYAGGGGGSSGTTFVTGTLSGIHSPSETTIRRLSNDTTMFIFFSVSGVLKYTGSLDGTTWSTVASVPSGPAWSSIISIEVVADVFYVWYQRVNGIGLAVYTLSGLTLNTPTTLQYTAAASGMGVYVPLAARFDGTYWHVLCKATQVSTSKPFIFMLAFTVAGSPPTITLAGQSQVGASQTPVAWDLVVTTTRAYVGIADSQTHNFGVWPLIWTPPSGSTIGNYGGVTSRELGVPYGGTDQTIALSIDTSNNLDVVLRDGNTTVSQIEAMKRIATNNYGPTYTIDTAAAPHTYLMLSRDSDTGSLYLFYTSNANQATGEIRAAFQINGSWFTPETVWGGTAGYYWPVVSPATINATIDLIFQQGPSSASGTIVYAPASTATAPQVPQTIAPSGPVDIGNIVFSWFYRNITPNDPQGWFHIQVLDPQNVSSPTVWDSGVIAGSASNHAYSGPALTSSYTYTWRIETGDSITNGGLGTSSGWSPAMSFVPSHVPSVSILDIQFGGNTYGSSPTTIDVSALQVDAQYLQTDGHPSNADQVFIYPSPIVTPLQPNGTGSVARTPLHPEAPYIATGGALSLSIDATGSLADATDYAVVVMAVDSVTGLVGFSAPFVIHTNFPPAQPVTGVGVTPHEENASVAFAWTNPASLVSLVIERAPTGTTNWTTLYTGIPITTFTAFPPINQAFDYRISTMNGSGQTSQVMAATDLIIGAGGLGAILMDALDPTLFVWLPAPDTWDSTKFKLEDDLSSYPPQNAQKPIIKLGPTDYWTASGLQFFVPADDLDLVGNPILGSDVVARLIEIKRRGEAYWRDRTGFSDYGLVTGFYRQIEEDIHYMVTFDWIGTDAPDGAVA
jgi:hypothetical protein